MKTLLGSFPLATRALLGGCCALAAAAVASAQPGNDICGQNIPTFTISPAATMVSGTLAGATRDALSTSCPSIQTGVDAYHYFTPAVTGLYTFDTCAGTSWDSVLSIYTFPCPVSTATEVPGACNDDSCGLQSRVSAPLIAGRAYILRVGAYQILTNPGPYTVTVSFAPVPTNDECGQSTAAPVPALTLDVPVSGDTTGATTSITLNPASLCGSYSGSGGGADVFYRFIPPSAGQFIFSTCGSTLDTVLSVHSGCPTTEANLIGCNDDGPSGFCPGHALNSQVVAALGAGQTYFVRVAGYRAGATASVGPFTLVVRRDPAAVLGACCAVGQPCAISTSSTCPGVYQGDQTTCAPDPCASTLGACCAPAALGGVCTIGASGECTGVYQGDGSLCVPNPCPQPLGACCIGALCLLRSITDCVSPGVPVGSVWNGSPACNSAVFTNVPCCRADFNKVGGVDIQDVFDFLAAWFDSSPFAHLAGDGTGSPAVQDIFDFLAVWFGSGVGGAGGC